MRTSTLGSSSASQTCWTGAAIVFSPVIFMGSPSGARISALVAGLSGSASGVRRSGKAWQSRAARASRSSYRSLGLIGIAVIRTIPSASSIADANRADEGITPASPAPLIPSGFSGDGVSRWSISIVVGTSVT